MTEYEAQAKQFLADCNATMEIRFIGKDVPPHWLSETKPHNKYQFTITQEMERSSVTFLKWVIMQPLFLQASLK